MALSVFALPPALENGAQAIVRVAGITNSIDSTLSGNSPAIGTVGEHFEMASSFRS